MQWRRHRTERLHLCRFPPTISGFHLQGRLVDILSDDPAILCLVAESQAELGELAVFMSPEILVMPPHVQDYLALWVPVGDQAVGNVFLRLLDILHAHLEVERAVRRNGALLKIL